MNLRSLVERRAFLRAASAAGVAGKALAAPSSGLLPTVEIGGVKMTRLVAGYNPIGGYSHSVPKMSAIMRNWFTLERVVEFLGSCEKNGINTWQASVDPKAFQALRQIQEAGSKLQWICLMRDEAPEVWKEILELKPAAVVHHGENTDRLYRSGDAGKVGDFVKKAHDFGVRAGISSHVPEHIARSEDADWGQDFYMTCFYNIRREQAKVQAGLGDLPVDELYLGRDPEWMTKVVRQVKRPCLGFKIFAAGRMCGNKASIEKAFRFAYGNIKPGDGVIVGMFPMLTDEVAEDAAIARRVLEGGGRGLSS
jgi:hypothetical protein